jgi:hypothetical protein
MKGSQIHLALFLTGVENTAVDDILTEASPFLGLLNFLGKRMSLDLYSFSRCTFCWSESTDMFLLLKSTAIPMVRAYFLEIPAA